jgi:ornithine carbamoyltransferase
VLEAGVTQLGRGETIADTARVLSRMVDAIMIRTDDHAKVEELARFADVPVINGLTDLSHPCQIMADLLTIIESGKPLPGLQVAWLGDGNNVLNSFVEAAGIMKFAVRAGCPAGFEPDTRMVDDARSAGGEVLLTTDPAIAAAGADVVVTDTWISMGQADSAAKIAVMEPFKVDRSLMARAKPDAVFLHCLPAHRGEEVEASVIDGPQSKVWDEAENRVHAQKAIMRWVFGQL